MTTGEGGASDEKGLSPGAGDEGAASTGAGDEGGVSGGAEKDGGGLSTGAKLALGCGGLAVVTMVGAVLVLGVGGMWLKDKADSFVEGVETQAQAQREATEVLQRLERESGFRPPDHGRVDPERAERFFRVTDTAWEEMRGWSEDLAELGERLEGGEAGPSDWGAVLEGYGRLAESRLVLARALDRHDMSLSEYLWTNRALTRAHRRVERSSEAEEVPAETRALVQEHREELEELADGEGDAPGKEVVLYLAWMWGTADGTALKAAGIDTLLEEGWR